MAGLEKSITSSEVVSDETGRQYHIALAPGELAEYIILVGDPGRATQYAALLENIRIEKKNREFYTYTGEYKGTEISVMSTGIGPSNVEIALVEIYQITKNPTFIRVGTSGGLQEHVNQGDLVISTGAVRLEDTSKFFVVDGYPAVASYEPNLALVSACEAAQHPYHLGLTASASGFYGAQGRQIPGVHIKYPQLPDELSKMNVYNFEMESSTLFTLSTMLGLRASTICLVLNNRQRGTFIDPEGYKQGEKNCMIIGLEAFKYLEEMDLEKEKKGKKYWFPMPAQPSEIPAP